MALCFGLYCDIPRKRITLFAVVAGSIVSCIFGATGVDAEIGGTRSTSNRVSDKDALIEVEHAWGNALLKKDVAGFSRCLAVQWVLITWDGTPGDCHRSSS